MCRSIFPVHLARLTSLDFDAILRIPLFNREYFQPYPASETGLAIASILLVNMGLRIGAMSAAGLSVSEAVKGLEM